MGGSTCRNSQQNPKKIGLGVGQHAGIVGQHEQEWWVNMDRNLQLTPNDHVSKKFLKTTNKKGPQN
jgi:hypothetical protein